MADMIDETRFHRATQSQRPGVWASLLAGTRSNEFELTFGHSWEECKLVSKGSAYHPLSSRERYGVQGFPEVTKATS